jgi:hypothetical protein
MCKNTDNNPTRNPIRVAALTHLTEMLQSLTKDNRLADLRATEDFLHLCVHLRHINAISLDEGMGFAAEFKELHAMHHRGSRCDCEPMRCEDCNAVVPLSMTEDIGGEITVCKACYDRQTDPRARDTASVEAGWDGRGDFQDTPPFMRGHPIELD